MLPLDFLLVRAHNNISMRSARTRRCSNYAQHIVWLLLACCGPPLEGSGAVREERRSLTASSILRIAPGLTVDVFISPENRATIRTDNNLFERVQLTQTNAELIVSADTSVMPTMGLRIILEIPVLERLTVGEGSNVQVDYFDAAASSLSVTAERGASVRLRGPSVASLDATMSVGAQVRAFALSTENVRVDASSGATLECTASQRVEGHAREGSRVIVRGRASLLVVTQSGATVTRE